MHITRIDIKNFRLLHDVSLFLENKTTVIVGRNNSGKTSLTELFRRLLSGKAPQFRLEDFSLCAHEQFWDAFLLRQTKHEDDVVRAVLPVIEVSLTLSYDKSALTLGPLSEFIIDLDQDCTEARLVIRYQLADGSIDALFEGLSFDEDSSQDIQRATFCRAIKDRVKRLYHAKLTAVDPNDSTNYKVVEWSQLQALLQSGFITAQRGLDDTTDRDRDVLGKILESLFTAASSGASDEKDRTAANALSLAVQGMQGQIDEDVNASLQSLLPAFSLFGYPGLGDPALRTETTLNVQRLLTDHTKVRYAGLNGVNLPEAYNGLGTRNLIFILLQLVEFFKGFKAKAAEPGVHLIFIEEPEAHLHPQMAEVFIRKLEEISAVFSRELNDGQLWPVQFVVTTHSTHMANEARFEAMRYFLTVPAEGAGNLRKTRIKDLREGLKGTSPLDREFLHQYMTLTRCDLLFADKALLIEGTTERLLLPKMIEKVDSSLPRSETLSSQYLSAMEVGGAYAQIFLPLLGFLEIRTLIITDLDSAKPNEKGHRVACRVAEGTHTTNSCITAWFNAADISPADLHLKASTDKTRGLVRLAYEMSELDGGPCGRSFEDAFMLANPSLFEMTDVPEEQWAESAWIKASKVKKTEFALKYALQETTWNVPRYIAEGLRWLAERPTDTLPLESSAASPLVCSDEVICNAE